MSKVGLKPRSLGCLTPEQQEFYLKLPQKQRAYVDFRGEGYNKTQSYQMAGFTANCPNQAAYMLESRNAGMTEVINALLADKKAKEITKANSIVNRQIDALANQALAENVIDTIENADGETARRIQFYRDIVTGAICTVRETKILDENGKLKSKRIEKIDDVETRMKARKELDRILGLNQLPDFSSMSFGDITINIVDASKKDEAEDERNKIVLDIDDTKEIDGEKVVVVEENEEIEPNSKKEEFFKAAANE